MTTRTPVATYSIVACDLVSGQWGVATQSKFLAVGSVVPWAEPQSARSRRSRTPTRSTARTASRCCGRASAPTRSRAADRSRRRTRAAATRRRRRAGRAATFTGSECHDWAGGRTGEGYAAQGNILVSAETVDALAETFESSAGSSLAERLLDCLDAAQAAGGDRRGQQSAALLVVEKDAGYAQLSDVVLDLRVDDHERPLEELRRIYGLHDALFGRTPKEQWFDVDDALRADLTDRLARLGYDGPLEEALPAWAGTENYEMRVDGVERIDPVVLEALRRMT